MMCDVAKNGTHAHTTPSRTEIARTRSPFIRALKNAEKSQYTKYTAVQFVRGKSNFTTRNYHINQQCHCVVVRSLPSLKKSLIEKYEQIFEITFRIAFPVPVAIRRSGDKETRNAVCIRNYRTGRMSIFILYIQVPILGLSKLRVGCTREYRVAGVSVKGCTESILV